ncbi:MAG: hypothetical protein QOJ13_2921 [Gaiellales bacterium]|jgi:hypothetical protein|nr:hypothetical protein [Gaiellales bacterium]
MNLLASSAAGGGALITVLAVIAIFYVIAAYPLFRVAKLSSDRSDEAWMAWVPIANVFLMCRLARVSQWSLLIMLVTWIPVLGWFVSFGYFLFLWVKIGERFGRTGLGVVAGLIPLIGAWIFAFSIQPETA